MAEKLPPPIKTDLFRFVTIRTPQLVSEVRKKLGFIFHPNPSKSFFLKNVDTDNIDVARRLVREKLDSFEPITSHEEIKEAVPEMNDFSMWLARNRNSITKGDLEKLDKLKLLGEEELLRIWDNLFYQTLKRKNPIIRQTCIQLIIANNFISLSRNPEIKKIAEQIIQTPKEPLPPKAEDKYVLFIKRLANSKVVIPKAFSEKRRQIEPGKKHKLDFEMTPGSIDIKKEHLLSKNDYRIQNYNKIKRELRLGVKSLGNPEKDLAALAESKGETPNFLSAETRSFLRANPTRGVTLKMAEELINESIKEDNRRTTRSINALKSSKGEHHIDQYSFVVSMDEVDNEIETLMTIYAGYSGAFLTSAEYEISFGDNNPLKDRNVTQIDTDKKNLLMLRLFPKQSLKTNEQTFRLKGQFSLNNGDTVSFDVNGSLHSKVTHGKADIVDTDKPEDIPELQDGKLFGVNRIGIGVFRKVEQEVCCYVPGEVSRIENILAREYKERSTRSLISTEVTEEETSEVEVETQSDTVSTNRNELATEVANALTKDDSIGTGASLGVTGKVPGVGEITADGYFDFASSTSASSSDSEAQTYAQEVTNSALERVLQRTTQKRTSRILSEFEENNRHGFDNRKGDQHVTGVYRWIDILYTNRVVNYGKRLMFEFLIPEPAKFYRLALERKAKQESKGSGINNQPEEPKHPSEYGINSPSDITEDNYHEMERLYDVTLEDPITTEDTITKSFGPSDDPNGDPDPNAKERSYQYKVNFLDFRDLSKYSAYEVSVDFNFDYHFYRPTDTGTYFILKIYDRHRRIDKNDDLKGTGGTSRKHSKTFNGTMEVSLPDIKNSLSLSAEIKNVYNFAINLIIKLKLDEQEVINWQNSVYDKIMKAYDDLLEEYEKAVADMEKEAAKEAEKREKDMSSGNPAFNRTLEQREIQRIAVEMLTKPFGIKMGTDFYFSGDCRIPQVEQTRKWEVYSSHVKFFEQAFDWSLMAYLFYPYYWADKCDWIDLYQSKAAKDPIFEAFLQSGMARAVIPVRKGFEEAVDYYMETGDIWNGGGLVLDTDDDLYLSIDEELQEVEGFVGKEWQTRVPTTLTIVQGSSVYLEDEGLPCCNKLEDAGLDTLLRPSTAILGTKD